MPGVGHVLDSPVGESPLQDTLRPGPLEPVRGVLSEKAKSRHQRSREMGALDRRCTRLLAQFLAARVYRNRKVQITRPRQGEQILEIDLTGCGIQEIRAAHNVGHALFRIIHDHGELVCKNAVGAIQHEIPDVCLEILRNAPLQGVVKTYACAGSVDPQCACFLSGRQAAPADARVHRPLDSRDAGIRDLAPAAGARINKAVLPQFMQRRMIGVGMRALADDVPVPVHPASVERAQNLVGRTRHDARVIDILDPHEPIAAATLRFYITAERGDERADMERAGGGGCEATAISLACRRDIGIVHRSAIIGA